MSRTFTSHFTTGPAVMPSPWSRYAPYFSGHVSDPIEDFLGEYEELADDCCLTSQQKVETIICYIPVALRDLWKLLEGYAARDWLNFKQTQIPMTALQHVVEWRLRVEGLS